MDDDIFAFPSTPKALHQGMYIRDYFAAHALDRVDAIHTLPSDIAREAYRVADAMMIERAKPAE